MATELTKVTFPSGDYIDLNGKVSKTGDTMTGKLIVPKTRIANTCYGVSFGRTTSTPKETILKTGIKWLSGAHMPVIHITGYAYGLQSPVEFKIGFYIYNNKIGYCGACNMGSWEPELRLFKYTRDSVDYVAVGFVGSCYFLQLQADVQDEMSKFAYIVLDDANWSWEFYTDTGHVPAADDGTTCCSVPYKANILNGIRNVSINGNYLRVNNNGIDTDLTIPYATSAGSATSATQDSDGNVITATYATKGGVVGNLGNLSSLGGGTPATATKTYWENNIDNLSHQMAYNNVGTEYTILFNRGINANYGTILKWGYVDKYLRILRKSSGNWVDSDWAKIYAGYADSAGSASTATSATSATTATTALAVNTAGGDVIMGTSGSSSDDSGDIVWRYGNGNEKARLWTDNDYTTKSGLKYRLLKKDGTSLYSGTIPLSDGTGASGTWGISITGSAASMYETNLKWGNTNAVGGVSPIGMSLSSEHSSNRLAYLNGDLITSEFSSDNGATWTNHDLSKSSKTWFCTYFAGINVGRQVGSTEACTLNSKTRITITAQDGTDPSGRVYTNPKKLLINVSTANSLEVLVEYRTGTNYLNDGAWTTFGTYPVSGWSGWNDIPLVLGSLGGGSTQTGNNWQLRLTFSVTSLHSSETYRSSCSVQGIRLFGENAWSTPSNLARIGHLYDYDAYQGAIFPGEIRPSVNNTVNLGHPTYKWNTVYATTFNGTATNLSGFTNTTTTGTAVDSATQNGHVYVNGTSGIYGITDGACFVQAYSTSWVAQIYQDYRTGQIALRGKSNGTWQSWRKVWDNVNLTSETAAASGTTLSLVTTGEKATWNAKADSDTKNTAGSTDTSSKIYLIGATSQAANPQTYSDDQVYVTNGTLQTKNTYATVSLCANTENSNTAGGLALYGKSPSDYGIAFRGTGQGGKHGYVQQDWAQYHYMTGNTGRGWIFRHATTGNVASIDGLGDAAFSGSITIGANTTNTSGVRAQYNSTTKSLDFVFVA